MFILDDENRISKRQAAAIGARIEVRADRLMAWEELTPLSDVSALGAGFRLKRPVKAGRLILLTIRMPRELRGYDFRDKEYAVWGLVRRCIKMEGPDGPRYSVGVAFVGKTPPEDHLNDPNHLYDLTNDEPVHGFWQIAPRSAAQEKPVRFAKERQQSRFDIPEEVTLELMDEKGWALASEMTVTLNISKNGASVYSQLNTEIGSVVRLSSSRNNVRLISIVRGKYADQAGLSRINLEFIDQKFPIDSSILK